MFQPSEPQWDVASWLNNLIGVSATWPLGKKYWWGSVLKEMKENVRGSLRSKMSTVWWVAKSSDSGSAESTDILGVGHSGLVCIPSD